MCAFHAAALLLLTALGCAPRANLETAPSIDSSAHPQAFVGVLLRGAMPPAGAPASQPIDVAIERTPEGLFIRAVGQLSGIRALDTIAARGLYLHDAQLFRSARTWQPGEPAMLTLRVGGSPASEAVWLLYGRVRQLTSVDNHPSGPVPAIAGCYRFENDLQARLDSMSHAGWEQLIPQRVPGDTPFSFRLHAQ